MTADEAASRTSAASYRCAEASEERAEDVAGSASTVRSFLLLEVPGPWGRNAVRDSRADPEVRDWLDRLEIEHRVRPLLLRRHGARGADGAQVYAARAAMSGSWLEGTRLADPREVMDLDVAALAAGRSPGLPPVEGPLFAVCTHGRHDACCAERGRPVAAALASAAPERTWEVSHIGGDRFAANVLVLPEGLYYGRMTAAGAARFAADHAVGLLDLPHLRGRSCLPFADQAAEIHLRRHLGERRVDALARTARRSVGTRTAVVFEVAGGERWRVDVETARSAPHQLTCRSSSPGPAPSYDLVTLRPLAR